MGAPGGAFFMGQACKMMAEGMKEALGLFKKIARHTGLPKLGDVPVLIKALSFNDAAVREEAHQALVWLAGRDLGMEPGPWEAWWERRAGLLRDEQAAREFFLRFRQRLLTGDWKAVYCGLSARLRREVPAESLRRCLLESARALRTVYREARLNGVQLNGSAAAVIVEWGEYGFEFDRLVLMREKGGWRFDRLPWSSRAVRQPPKALRTNKLPLRRLRHRESVFVSRLSWPWMAVSVVMALVIGAIMLRGAAPLDAFSLPGWIGATILMGLGLAFFGGLPAVLLYSLTIGRLKNSRELHRDVRRDGQYRARDRR